MSVTILDFRISESIFSSQVGVSQILLKKVLDEDL